MAVREVFEDIPAHEWEGLQRHIARASGKVIVIVHPFFYQNSGETADSRATKRNRAEFDEQIQVLMRQQKIPVVILEDWRFIERTQDKLRNITRGKPLIVPTQSESWVLRHRGSGHIQIRTDDLQRQLIERLHSYGARTVTIAGAEALRNEDPVVEAYERQLHKNLATHHTPLTGSCAGNTYANFIKSEHFKDKVVSYRPAAVFPYHAYARETRPRRK
tara:strand:+ start:435 stop:1088 length:654 start_codon:yes stop_codon:yes gene_type:complete